MKVKIYSHNTNNFLVAVSDGELLTKLNWLRETYEGLVVRLSTCSSLERTNVQCQIKNAEVCFNQTKTLLNMIGYTIQPLT